MIWFSVYLKYPKNLLLILLPVLELLPVYGSVCRRSWTWQKPFGIFSYYYYYHFFVKPLPVESSSFRFSSLSSEYDLKMMTVSVKSGRAGLIGSEVVEPFLPDTQVSQMMYPLIDFCYIFLFPEWSE